MNAAGARGSRRGGSAFGITVFVLFAGSAALAADLERLAQGLAAAGFLVGGGLMLARPQIESRRRLRFAIPPGGADAPSCCSRARRRSR